MIQGISSSIDGLPEEVRRFYVGNVEYVEYDNGRVLPIIKGGAFDDDDDDSDDSDDANDDDSSDDEEDDDDSDDAGGKDGKAEPDKKDLRIRDLSRESAKYRRRLREERKSHEDTRAELEKVKKDGVSDEKLRKSNEDLQARVDSLTAENNNLRITQEIHKYVGELNLDPKRVKAIIRVIDLEDIDVDDDGVSGVREALEQIAQDFPEWVVKNSGGDDDNNDDGGSRPGGQSSRKPRKKAEGVDRNELLKIYPALAG